MRRLPGLRHPTRRLPGPPPETKSTGGQTKLTNLVLLCAFHHLIAVHQWGWTLTLHADGTLTAASPDHSRTLHSHGPPQQAA